MSSQTALPPAYLFSALAAMVLLHLFVPVHQLIPPTWNTVGLLPLIAGMILNLAADKALKKSGTTVKPFEPTTTLITTGVYGLSRNPMYLGMTLILIGVALLMGSITPCIVIPVFAVIIDKTFIGPEEHKLEQRFGQTWMQYQQKVRRWL